MNSPAARFGWTTKLALAVLTFIVLFELACQLYGRRVIARQQALRERPDHYFAPSDNPTLGYELARSKAVERDGRTLRLNDLGIREDADGVPENREVIGILGDSVVFGTGLDQDETISAKLQSLLDPDGARIKVLNWGVPGYNLDELLELLKVRQGRFRASRIVYLLNPNDFCRRNTRFEGADNGLYRMYHPPRLMSPWFLRKLLYRFRKDGLISLDWYRWVYEGNRQRGLGVVQEMAEYCRTNGAAFTVALLPAGIAYDNNGTYMLSGMYDEITSTLAQRGIDVANPWRDFSERPARFFTDSDHLTPAGNERMAEILARHQEPARETTSQAP